MTNNQVFKLQTDLAKLKDLKGVKFNYCVSKNLALLDGELKALKDTLKMSDEYKAFDQKRVDLAKEFAQKDENGKPKLSINPETKESSYLLADQKAFNIAFKKLQEDNQEVVDQRTKQLEDFNLFIEKESTVALYKIKLEDISPEITTEQMVDIYPLIEE